MVEKFPVKSIDLGFIVTCDSNLTKIKRTINSIKLSYPQSELILVAKEDLPLQEQVLKEINLLKGINAACKKISKKWIFIIKSGSFLRAKTGIKYSRFMESEKDILFAIIDWHLTFIDNTFQGVMISKNAFTEVGDFLENFNLEQSKLLWALKAMKLGYVFKGIVGAEGVLI